MWIYFSNKYISYCICSFFFVLFSSVTMIEDLSNVSLRAILDHAQAHFAEFLRLPHYKQINLAEKAVTELVNLQDEIGQYCFPCKSYTMGCGVCFVMRLGKSGTSNTDHKHHQVKIET